MSMNNPFQSAPAATAQTPPRQSSSGGEPSQNTSQPSQSWKSSIQQLSRVAAHLNAVQPPEDTEPTPTEARAFRQALQVVNDDIGRLKRAAGIGKV